MREGSAKEQVVLVTGGARRVGRCIVEIFHQAGFNVIVHYRESAEAATELCQALEDNRPNSTQLWQHDLCEDADFADLITQINASVGRLDVLVNNASTFQRTPMGQATTSDWDSLFGSNVKGAYFLTQALAPLLMANQGAIVNITDIHAKRPMRDYGIYCMAKSALTMMTKVMAKELAPDVRVNAIAPGVVDLPEGDNALTPDMQQQLLSKIPMQRFGSTQDIANAVYQLATSLPYVTGQTLAVAGGRI